MERARRLAFELVLVLVAVIAVSAWQRRDLLSADGRPAPAVTLRDLQGGSLELSALRGKRVQLHFWATWCSVCRLEHAALESVHASLDPDEVLLTVAVDAEPETVRRYVAREGLGYPVYWASREVVDAFAVGSLPTNYFIDAAGRIVGRDVGMQTRWGMRTRLGCAD